MAVNAVAIRLPSPQGLGGGGDDHRQLIGHDRARRVGAPVALDRGGEASRARVQPGGNAPQNPRIGAPGALAAQSEPGARAGGAGGK